MKRFVIVALAAFFFALPISGVANAHGRVSSTIVNYGVDPLQTVTVYAAITPRSPMVVLIHGGGFRSSAGDAAHLATKAHSLVNAGFAVFTVNYRDDRTSGAFPNQVVDVLAGTRWAIANAAMYNADPARTTILGGSSGGTLAALAAESLGSTVRHVIPLCVNLDLDSS
jgi:acetyl esterase/lipase